jgi:hypothetical protein
LDKLIRLALCVAYAATYDTASNGD